MPQRRSFTRSGSGSRLVCPLCDRRVRHKLPLFNKTDSLLLIEKLKRKNPKAIGVRRVCPDCWYEQSVQSCTKEELAALFVLYTTSGLSIGSEGFGRGFKKEVQEYIELRKKIEEDGNDPAG